jgi:chemotaxis protein MotB
MAFEMETKPPIIIKRVSGGKDGHHGGAWKVAYADFVTAMMAFFLLMWLLNATTEQQRKGLADYFDPSIPIGRLSSGGRDLLNGNSITSADTLAHTGKGTRRSRFRADGGETEEVRGGVHDDELGKSQDGIHDDLSSMLDEINKLKGDTELSAHLLVREVPEGLLIEIVDTDNMAMFVRGSARPTPRMELILQIVAEAVDTVANDLVVIGHTDGVPFQPGADEDNLGLSIDRAKATRALLDGMLVRPSRVIRIEGRGDQELLIPDEPHSAVNRRVGLLVLS